MAQNFLACDRDQELLLPPSLRECCPSGTSRGLLSTPLRRVLLRIGASHGARKTFGGFERLSQEQF